MLSTDEQKQAVFLSVNGAKTCKLIQNLVVPEKPGNIRLEGMQSELVQSKTLLNELRTGFSDDFLNQGTARAAQGLDKVVEELKEKLDSISRPTP